MLVSNSVLIQRVLMVFSLTIFGVAARKTGIIKEEVRQGLAEIIMNLTVPPLIFVAVATDLTWEQLTAGIYSPLIALMMAVIVMAGILGLGRLLHWPGPQTVTLSALCAIPNTGFIGLPVIFAVLGREGLAYAVLYDVGVTIAYCTLVIWAFNGRSKGKQGWRTLINPALLGMAGGLLCNWLGITIPEVVLTPLQIMGNATTPLAMLLMGSMLGGVNLRNKRLVFLCGLIALGKLIIYPLLAYLLVLPSNLPPLVRAATLLQAAMPSMASTPVLTQKYGGDNELAVTAVFITTLLSLLTLPLVVYWLV